jgi:site-specific recombinase XerD
VKVLDQLRERIRYVHYSIRTEAAYVYWVRAFIRFHGVRHPATMGGEEVEAFLSWLANTRHVAVSTHRQALSALLFLYGKVLGVDLPWMTEIGRPHTKRRLPAVLSPDEVARILCLLDGSSGCSRSCCTALGCASLKGCSCASRTSTSAAGRSSFAKAKAARIGR